MVSGGKIQGREEILRVIGECKPEFARRYGVTRLGVFGSVARGRHHLESDVDVVVEMNKPDIYYLVHMKNELESVLGRSVEILQYRESMNKFLRERIRREAVYV